MNLKLLKTTTFDVNSKKQRCLRPAPCHQPWQHLSAAIDPSTNLLGRAKPVPLIDAPTQRGCLQPTRAKVEGEIHDCRKPRLRLSSQHRAVAQRGAQCRDQVACQLTAYVYVEYLEEYNHHSIRPPMPMNPWVESCPAFIPVG